MVENLETSFLTRIVTFLGNQAARAIFFPCESFELHPFDFLKELFDAMLLFTRSRYERVVDDVALTFATRKKGYVSLFS